ncbi:hypothetical protein EYC80_000914 [Monilinia laxa]|uniref:Heterokaryon incompatibility domain-containing protein n=1 Tax=Monilinia laxa TaxID=61186 RepID=A0A5N6K7H0_MONLA|nr:hypothetical protein EYC80_000914 [Monilinia laxa]
MKRFSYDPLDSSVDGIRLLHLFSGPNVQQPRCFLRHATFGERPKYDALSYTWGYETRDYPISLNDQQFFVAKNLYDALVCMQQQSTEGLILWIDAICINQDDILERNHQLKIIPYIYERAKLVVIWLRKEERLTPPVWPEPKKIAPFEMSAHTQQRQDQLLLFNYLMKICLNEYWSRLWIVQEIGKARKIIISFGFEVIDWQRFVETITLPWPQTMETVEQIEGPVNHRQALCQEPRDKIYGLIGLATDCYAGFPMDYRKTLYEVWKDTILFKNSDTEVPQGDILKFGKLVRDSLGGPRITTMKDVAEDAFMKMPQKGDLGRSPKENNPTVLKIPTRLVGRIVHLGPSYEQIITDLSKTADWRLNIQRHLSHNVQARVQEESDLFLELLEGLDKAGLKVVSTCDFDVSWIPMKMPQGLCEPNFLPKNPDLGNEPLLRDRPFHSTFAKPQFLPASSIDGARLFLLDNSIGETSVLDGTCITKSDPPGSMGLGSSVACVGDYLCEFAGIKRAAIIRRSKNKLRFIGTAGLAQQANQARKSTKVKLNEVSSPFGLPKFEHPTPDETVDLYLYVPLAYQLLD